MIVVALYLLLIYMSANVVISLTCSRRTAHIRQAISEWSDNVAEIINNQIEIIRRYYEQKKRDLDIYWRQVAEQWRRSQPNFDNIRPHLDRLIESAKIKLNGMYHRPFSLTFLDSFLAGHYY